MYERIGGFTATRGTLPGGDRGTRKTLAMMRKLAIDGARDPEVREAAISALQRLGVREHDPAAEAEAMFRFVRDQVRFTGDIVGVETLQSPRYTLKVMAGDCDDRATLLAAMMRSIGVPAELQFRVAAMNPAHPGRFSHVYVVANIRGRRVPLDPTYRSNRSGYQHPGATRMGDYRV